MRSGIKVLIFCPETENEEICTALAESFSDFNYSSGRQISGEDAQKAVDQFLKAKLLSFYTLTRKVPDVEIEDGKTEHNELALRRLSDVALDFNYEQYIVEHAEASRNLIIEAGAGTGKTTVRVSRGRVN